MEKKIKKLQEEINDLLLGAETNLKDKDSEEMCEISSQENSFTFKRFNNYIP